MGTTRKQLFIGAPLALVAGLAIALLAVWAWGPVGGASGVGDTAKVTGVIEYSVYDANGNVKLQNVIRNVDNPVLHNDARARLGINGTVLADTGLYNNIQLCATDQAATAACTTLTDAGAGTPNITGTNPREGDGAPGGDGVYTVTLTFAFVGAGGTIQSLQLCKGTAADNVACAATDTGAAQDIGLITMAATDSIQIVWTITVA